MMFKHYLPIVVFLFLLLNAAFNPQSVQAQNKYSCFWAGGVGCNIRQDSCQPNFEAGGSCASLTKTACDANPEFDCVPQSNCGGSGQRCCKNQTQACGSGLFCQVSSDTCLSDTNQSCGSIGQSCCSGNTCPNGTNLVCGTNGICAPPPCGRIGEQCCTTTDPATQCGVSLTCDQATKKCGGECGKLGKYCCAGTASGSTCADGSTCASDGYCQIPSDCGDLGKKCCTGTTACFSGECAIDNTCTKNVDLHGGKFTGNCNTAGGQGIDTAIGCVPITGINESIGYFLAWTIGIIGGIAFLLIIVSGIMIITSSGNPERLQAGRELLTAAISGVVLVVFCIVIMRTIGATLGIPIGR